MRSHGSLRSAALILVIGIGGPNLAMTAQDDCAAPSWLYPANSPSEQVAAQSPDEQLHLSGSSQAYTYTQLHDLNFAPDWHPDDHAPMPESVSRGRAPMAYACGYCHTPTGQGRPENSQLAGLPAAYITSQVMKFASGARRGAWCGPYRPSDLMLQVAQHATSADVASAAAYFAQQAPRSRVRVVETDRVPRSRVVGLVLQRDRWRRNGTSGHATDGVLSRRGAP